MVCYNHKNKKGIIMKKMFILLGALALGTSLYAASACTFAAKTSKLTFTAFKTPLKIGVSGSFDDYVLNTKPAATQNDLLRSSSVTINTKSVNSGNKGRDAKLIGSFFEVQGVSRIKAKVLKVQNNIADVAVSMNSITKTVPMHVTINGDDIELHGVIDLADFNMLRSLQSINKACYTLHKGKTWQDVTLKFVITTEKKPL